MHEHKDGKRSREVNWTSEERECLRQAVEPYISIIEDRLNDAATIARKNKAWEKVQRTMLAAGYDREVDRIRQCWARMKLADRQSQSGEGNVGESNYHIADSNKNEYNMTEGSSADGESVSHDNEIAPKLEVQEEGQKSAKRVREINWTAREKAYLRKYVDAHMVVIEDKGNDHVTIKRKREAWKQIRAKMLTKGYNRSEHKMRQQWVRMKLAARQAKQRRDTQMSEMSSAESDDMYFGHMKGPGLEEDPILIARNLQDHKQEHIEENLVAQHTVYAHTNQQDQSSSNELHMLQVELLRAQIQHQRTLEYNTKELHDMKMRNEREMHSLKMDLIRQQITGQRCISNPQEDPNIQEVNNCQLWN